MYVVTFVPGFSEPGFPMEIPNVDSDFGSSKFTMTSLCLATDVFKFICTLDPDFKLKSLAWYLSRMFDEWIDWVIE